MKIEGEFSCKTNDALNVIPLTKTKTKKTTTTTKNQQKRFSSENVASVLGIVCTTRLHLVFVE